jgi:Flp pilus assembly pilin Flp
MLKFFKRFLKNEEGAVTVDWVVLTAAVVGLAAAAVVEIRGGNDALSSSTSEYLERQDVQSNPDILDSYNPS